MSTTGKHEASAEDLLHQALHEHADYEWCGTLKAVEALRIHGGPVRCESWDDEERRWYHSAIVCLNGTYTAMDEEGLVWGTDEDEVKNAKLYRRFACLAIHMNE